MLTLYKIAEDKIYNCIQGEGGTYELYNGISFGWNKYIFTYMCVCVYVHIYVGDKWSWGNLRNISTNQGLKHTYD